MVDLAGSARGTRHVGGAGAGLWLGGCRGRRAIRRPSHDLALPRRRWSEADLPRASRPADIRTGKGTDWLVGGRQTGQDASDNDPLWTLGGSSGA